IAPTIPHIVLFPDYGITPCVVADLYARRCGRPEPCREWGYFYSNAAHEVLLALGEKDGFITPERLDKLKSEVLKHRSFNALSLPGL
ncbi:hypothetical protein MJO10_28185, partial [Salmonella enterica subsp. enterica serovar Anatum]|nr:hypothetical protein [Salmonella enterica subsp. enterica serovar Anatum]